MGATNQPFGLRPIRHPSGQVRPFDIFLTKAVAEAMGSMAMFQPVKINAAGGLDPIAANNVSFVGVFLGIWYTDNVTGRPVVSKKWVTGTTVKDVGVKSARVSFTRDPLIIYEIQANGPLAISDIGSQIGFVDFASVSLDNSQIRADTGVLTNSGSNPLRILSAGREVDNDWTDAYPIIETNIALHQDVADKVGY